MGLATERSSLPNASHLFAGPRWEEIAELDHRQALVHHAGMDPTVHIPNNCRRSDPDRPPTRPSPGRPPAVNTIAWVLATRCPRVLATMRSRAGPLPRFLCGPARIGCVHERHRRTDRVNARCLRTVERANGRNERQPSAASESQSSKLPLREVVEAVISQVHGSLLPTRHPEQRLHAPANLRDLSVNTHCRSRTRRSTTRIGGRRNGSLEGDQLLVHVL